MSEKTKKTAARSPKKTDGPKSHPQQATAAFFVIFIHAAIIGFLIRCIIPFYWAADLSTQENLLYFLLLTVTLSLLLALFSSYHVFRTGALNSHYVMRVGLYSAILTVLAQTVLVPFATGGGTSSFNVSSLLHELLLELCCVFVMAFLSWGIWDKWRKTRTYD